MTITSEVEAQTQMEEALRADLAAAHRLAALNDLVEGTWNHFTHRLPDGRDGILMTPPAVHWSRVRASDLTVVTDEQHARELGAPTFAGYSIHRPLYDARPELSCVFHLHPPYTTALASVEGGRLEPAAQHAITLHSKIAYAEEYSDDERGGELRGWALAEALGDAEILILNHHGVVVVGRSIGAAYTNLYLVERACRVQILAMSTGRPLAVVPERYLEKPTPSDDWKVESFRGLRAMLDATQPDYID
jgi:ribulose-5-phosphate 4-epimerase/fuculose-1-phosphate aldolase